MDQVWAWKKAKDLKKGMIIAIGNYAHEIGKIEQIHHGIGNIKKSRKEYIKVLLYSSTEKEQHEIDYPEEWLELHPENNVMVAVSGINHLDYIGS